MVEKNKGSTDFDLVIKKHVWRLIGIGSVASIVLVVLVLAGYRYANTPGFCGSCHSMEKSYFSWGTSSHKQFACIECHLPHGNTVHTILYKTYAGVRDVFGETVRNYPYTFNLSNHARDIASENCIRCHFSTIENTAMVKDSGTDCMKCHKFLVHGRDGRTGRIQD